MLKFKRWQFECLGKVCGFMLYRKEEDAGSVLFLSLKIPVQDFPVSLPKYTSTEK